MGIVTQEAIDQLQALMEDQVDESFKTTFQNIHQGRPADTLARFLKAREGNVTKAHKMLVDCLKWRVENEIDYILEKPIVPAVYRAIRDSHLIGLSGYSREGLPVFAIGVGLSTFDKASLLTIISTIDDLNYPEKTLTYYIVNAPYIFSACWKVVKPLLHERTRQKVQVLSGCGQDDLLKVMDHASLPHFCRREGSGSSRHASDNCFSLDHSFHQELYNYIKQQSAMRKPVRPVKQGSVHVALPESGSEDMDIGKALESELQKFDNQHKLNGSLEDLKINHD
ncbi:SEC14 cytosolic factor isoform X3 [Diospyros lotus]|uniref:SEC14 cytosolic factor isoform X3 n=1 Tax=Diospyros lotus TaxID=55363 RepID=UPI0022528E53|nr:SEC14 cytosolic factor isoform X3 [Diospyros lotus]